MLGRIDLDALKIHPSGPFVGFKQLNFGIRCRWPVRPNGALFPYVE